MVSGWQEFVNSGVGGVGVGWADCIYLFDISLLKPEMD